jgi:uncharacterized protein
VVAFLALKVNNSKYTTMSNLTNFQIPIDKLSQIETLDYEKVSPSAYVVAFIVNGLFFTLFTLVTFVLWFFIKSEFYIVLLIYGVLSFFILLSVLYSWYYYRLLKYALREKDITLKEGVIFLSSTTMPFSRVQHVEVNQSFFQRYFKISTLLLYTAGGTGVDLSIKGLEEDKAEKIKSFIINKTVYTKQNHGEEE